MNDDRNTNMKNSVTFLMKLAKAFHRYGTNSPRIERAMNTISATLGLEGNFIVTPTSIIMSVENEDEQILRVQRTNEGHVNLRKLCEVDAIADSVASGDLSVEEASVELDRVIKEPNLYHPLARILSFALAAYSLGTLFGGSISDSLVSALIGSILGVFSVLEKQPFFSGDLFLTVGTFVCTFTAFTLKQLFPSLNFQIITLSSIIAVIPGLPLTIAMIELSAHHLVSGTSRLMGVVVDFFKISLGVMAAVKIGTAIWGSVSPDVAVPFSELRTIPAVLLGAFTFVIIFNARLKEYGWFLLSAGAAIYTIRFFSTVIGTGTAIFLASLIVAMLSNIFARTAKRPAQIMLLPGLIFLVPGSMGFHGVNLIVHNNSNAGIDIALQALTVSMTLVAGLLFANYVINPRRSL